MVMRGVPLKAVQELLGHSTIQMTMRYSHLSPDVRRSAVEVLDRSIQAPERQHDGNNEDGRLFSLDEKRDSIKKPDT